MAIGGFGTLVKVLCAGFILLLAIFAIRIPDNATALAFHDPIHIVGDAGFNAANGVTEGSGTFADPYLIEGWEISGNNGIWIENTESHFIIRDVTLSGGSIELASCSNGHISESDIIANGDDAIALWSCSNIEVSGCHLVAGEYGGAGVRVHIGQNIAINSCDIEDCYWGIFVYDLSSYVNVTENRISNCTYYGGICAYDSDHVTISRNTLSSAGIGVASWRYDDYQTLSIDANNSIDGKPVYFFKNRSDVTIDRIPIGELIVVNCDDFRASNLSLTSVFKGISIAHSQRISIQNCTFASAGNNAIDLYTCTDASLFRNDLDSFQVCGINIDSSSEVVAMYNTLAYDSEESSHLGRGIQVIHSTAVMLKANKLIKNWDGIQVWDCDDIDIWHNAMLEIGFDGISLSGSTNVRITDNLISSCAEAGTSYGAGLGLYSSSQVVVFGNSFVNNYRQVYVESSDLVSWNDSYPIGGNYWSDYSGTDLSSGSSQNISGSDDIGDSPYVIDASNTDNFPLMASRIPNLAPVALFVVHPTSGNTTTSFEVNSSASWDIEDSSMSLLVRWDWEGDGEWDTGWATNRTAEHTYLSEGNYTLRLQVKDSEGLTGDFLVPVSVVQIPRGSVPGDHTIEIVAIAMVVTFVALVALLVLWKRRRPPSSV